MKKPLIYAALWARFSADKGLIPKPSKSRFYCVTGMQQRSDEAMAVFRVERNKGYTVMSNHHLRNKELSLRICHNGLQAHKRFAGLAVALCFQYSQGSEGKCSFRRLLSCGFHFCLSALLLWLARKLQSHTKVLVFLP